MKSERGKNANPTAETSLPSSLSPLSSLIMEGKVRGKYYHHSPPNMCNMYVLWKIYPTHLRRWWRGTVAACVLYVCVCVCMCVVRHVAWPAHCLCTACTACTACLPPFSPLPLLTLPPFPKSNLSSPLPPPPIQLVENESVNQRIFWRKSRKPIVTIT